ncbi:MAG: hypothetical protein ACPG21_12015 [Crocinitomicaceae bacterium]
MNEFDTLDENLDNGSISDSLKKGFKEIAPWAKYVAIANIIFQSISFLVSFFDPNRGVAGNAIGVSINITLNVVLLQMANEMKSFGLSGSEKDLMQLLQKQLNYWIFTGVLLILGLVFILIGLLALSASGGRFL